MDQNNIVTTKHSDCDSGFVRTKEPLRSLSEMTKNSNWKQLISNDESQPENGHVKLLSYWQDLFARIIQAILDSLFMLIMGPNDVKGSISCEGCNCS